MIKFFRNLELEYRDWIVFLVSSIIFLSTLSLFLYEDRSGYQSKQKLVGTVIYRNRVAQRKNSTTVIWDNVKQRENVYNFDSIRTDELAEAIIILESGTQIELDPHSMIVLNITEKDSKIQLQRGSILVRPVENDKLQLIRGNRIHFNIKGLLRIFGEEVDRYIVISDKGFSMVEGNRDSANSFEDNVFPEGEVLEIDANTQVRIDSDRMERVKNSVEIIYPVDNTRYFTGTNMELEVKFHWKSEAVMEKILIAKDPFFQKTIIDMPVNIDKFRINLSEGNYYWKVIGKELESVPARFKIKSREEVKTIEPIPNEKLILDPGDLTAFIWSETELAESYRLEIATDSSFQNPIKKMVTQRPGLSVSIPEGKYYWRVVSVGSLPGSDYNSNIAEFEIARPIETLPSDIIEEEVKNLPIVEEQESVSIEKETPQPKIQSETSMKPPIPIYPKSSVDMASKERLVFSWKPSKAAAYYEFIFRNETGVGQEILRKKVNSNQFIISDLSILDIGNFSWEVIAYGKNEESATTGKVKIKILLSDEPDAPDLEIK